MSAAPSKGRIALAGALAQKPAKAGHAWVFLQYLLGLRQLGYEPLFIDQLPGSPRQSQLRWFHEVLGFPAQDLAGILLGSEGRPIGHRGFGPLPEAPSRADCLALIEDSLALINVQGFLRDSGLLRSARRRVFLDIDPGFTQMWQDLGLSDLLDGHDAYASVGGRIGQPDCRIPTCGKRWIHFLPPVHLPSWPAAPVSDSQANPRLTSIVSWRGAYGPLDYKGRRYGLRVHEFRRFADLPALTAAALRGGAPQGRDSGNGASAVCEWPGEVGFQLALDIDRADDGDRRKLLAKGWEVIPAEQAAGDLRAYRNYIRGSLAELLVAKNIYVQSRSGWFSDRSACYLASGRPVLAQGTGLEDILPLGDGLLAFSTPEEAARQVSRLLEDYSLRARSARRLAENHLDARKVLRRLLKDAEVDG